MEWLGYLAATLFVALGALCLALTVIQLPGPWLLLAFALLLEWLDRLYLPAGARSTFSAWTLWGSLGLALLGELIEFLAGVLGTQRGGGTSRGMWGAFLGGLLGALVLTPLFFFAPLIGTLLGALAGTLLGAVLGELSAQRSRGQGLALAPTLRPALWATLGRLLGTTGKLALAIAMWLVLSIDAFYR
jgi:uncharacterized protein